MVMGRELVKCLTQVPFAERDDAIEVLVLDRADDPLRVGIAVRRTWRRPNYTHACGAQPLLYPAAPLRIAVTQENPTLAEQPVRLSSHLAQALNDERFVRVWRAADHLHPT